MHMWKPDSTDAFGMPMMEKKFLAFQVEDFIQVASGPDMVGLALIVGDMDDGVLVRDVEQQIGPSTRLSA